MPFQHPTRIRGARMRTLRERVFKIAEANKDEEAIYNLKALNMMNRKDMSEADMSLFDVIERTYPFKLVVAPQ